MSYRSRRRTGSAFSVGHGKQILEGVDELTDKITERRRIGRGGLEPVDLDGSPGVIDDVFGAGEETHPGTVKRMAKTIQVNIALLIENIHRGGEAKGTGREFLETLDPTKTALGFKDAQVGIESRPGDGEAIEATKQIEDVRLRGKAVALVEFP